MTAFEYVSVALSLVVGLSVTRLLTAGLHLFVHRDRVAGDWITVTWAVFCFFWQLQFWWAIFEFGRLPRWTFGGFLLLVGSAVLLYAASALILPGRRDDEVDLEAHFLAHGRWGVLFLMIYFLSAFVVGPVLWGPETFFAREAWPIHGLNLTTVGLGFTLIGAPGRPLRAAVTLISVVVQGFMYFVSVPWAY